MQKSRLKIILPLLVVITIVLVIIYKGCGKNGEQEYVFSKVTKGMVRKTISVTGVLDIKDPVNILSKSSGVVENVYTDFNQWVSQGKLLIKMDSTAVEQKILKSQGLVESTKYELSAAERDLEGKRNLFKDNLISKKALEMAEIEYNTVLNKYKNVKLDYELTLKERSYTRIHSPINGIVVAVYVKENVPVNISSPLILLAPDLKKMVLTINVDESDIGYIKKGQSVQFSVSAYPDNIFNGTIDQVRINPVKNGGLVTYEAIVLCENSEMLLRPGMTATATVIVSEKKDVLMISSQAFYVSPDESDEYSGKKILWKKTGLVGDSTVKGAEVKTGLQGDLNTEIIEGVKENDEILVRIKGKK